MSTFKNPLSRRERLLALAASLALTAAVLVANLGLAERYADQSVAATLQARAAAGRLQARDANAAPGHRGVRTQRISLAVRAQQTERVAAGRRPEA